MKKILFIIYLNVCTITIGNALDNSNLFYYGLDNSVNNLSILTHKIGIRKGSNISKNDFINNLAIPSMIHDVEWRGENLCILNIKAEYEISDVKKKIQQKQEDITFLKVYLINNHVEAVLNPEIVVKAKSPEFNMRHLISKYDLVIKKEGKFHIYSVPQESDVIKIANQIYETGEFVFSYPHFHIPFHYCSYIPNDTYFNYQIACHNIGQEINYGHTGTIDADIDAPEAWDITKGSPNIVIAVFDAGVTSNHPDLPNSRQVRLNGSNFGWGNSDNPSPNGNNNHGNACAGVIAASMDNNEGIAGIAPNCKIMPLLWDEEKSATMVACCDGNGRTTDKYCQCPITSTDRL